MQQQIAIAQMFSPVVASPRLIPTWVRPATKLALFAAVSGAIMATAYLVLPTLQAAGAWGYLAGFMIQGVSSASIMAPVPGLAALMVMAQELDPVLLAGAGAAGAALGELTGYWLGAQGRGVAHRFRIMAVVQSHMDKRGGLIILLFSMVPVLPMDAIGIMSGAVRFPIAKFLFATFIGRLALLLGTFLAARGVVEAIL